MGTWRHLAAKVGKQWQTTPKNLPRTQRARAIPVAWLGSGSCQNRPKGWILMMIMVLFIDTLPHLSTVHKFLRGVLIIILNTADVRRYSGVNMLCKPSSCRAHGNDKRNPVQTIRKSQGPYVRYTVFWKPITWGTAKLASLLTYAENLQPLLGFGKSPLGQNAALDYSAAAGKRGKHKLFLKHSV
jgi:hypothetical protein